MSYSVYRGTGTDLKGGPYQTQLPWSHIRDTQRIVGRRQSPGYEQAESEWCVSWQRLEWEEQSRCQIPRHSLMKESLTLTAPRNVLHDPIADGRLHFLVVDPDEAMVRVRGMREIKAPLSHLNRWIRW